MPLRSFFSDRKRLTEIAALLLVGGLLLFYGGRRLGAPVREYSKAYALVADKVSKSAAIIVNLPKGWDKAAAQIGAAFEPAITGQWIETPESDRLAYKPLSPLEAGKYYAVILKANGAEITKDFLADDDPAVSAIFPAKGTEADERSEITVVFNRPMVPLTALDVLEKKEIPIEISPPTAGKFRWTTTRNLQFIPESRLHRSSRYRVSVKDGLVSMDGIAVSPFTHEFITRPLRYADGTLTGYAGSQTMLVHQPIRIAFNQPVDLARTRAEISVIDTATRREVPVIVSYATRVVRADGKEKTYTDKSVLEVIGAADRHGRARLWDFKMNYQITVRRAYPAEGDTDLTESRNAVFQVPEIIAGFSADSPRSKLVVPDVFDPQGRLVVNFYESIDKERTVITADELASVAYGEKCKEPENDGERWYGSREDCEKVPDQKRLLLSFHADRIGLNRKFSVTFERIVNEKGLILNAEPITRDVKAYDALKVSRTVPENGATAAKLTQLVVCTNTPLTPATEENFSDRVRASEGVGKWSWYAPRRVGPGIQGPCAVGEFENTIRYGLAPEREYQIVLNLIDDFGQTAERKIAFTSERLPAEAPREFQHLQKEYNVTTPERVKLTYAVRNLDYVNMRLCKISAERMLNYLVNRPTDAMSGDSFACESESTHRIELPDRYWTTNYFQVNLADYAPPGLLGHYIVTFSHPEYRRMQYDSSANRSVPGEQIFEHSLITVTKLAAQEKSVEWRTYDYDEPDPTEKEHTKKVLGAEPRNLYWVTETGTLRPVLGAAVQIYRTDDPDGWGSNGRRIREIELVETTATNGSGIARAKAVTNIVGAVVRNGKDSTVVLRELDKFQWAGGARSVEQTYLYADRPIYRPGEEVRFKGLYRLGYDGNWEIFRDKKAKVEVRNSKQEKIYAEELEVSDFGTITGKFTLAAQAPLGTYTITAPGGYYSFDVEEYVPAAFKAEARSDKEEYIAGDIVKLEVQADYYFGVPVGGGDVEYSFLAQDYYFDRSRDTRFSFGSGWYYGEGGYGASDRFILRGKAALDSSGRARIERALDFNALFKDEDARKRSKILVLNVTVKNENGQSVSAQKSFIVHRGEFYLGARLDRGYFAKNEANMFRLKTLDTTGNPRAVRDIAVTVNRVKWEYAKRQEVDGRYYYRSERKLQKIREWNAETDENGDYETSHALDAEGEYEISVVARDRRGNEVSDTYGFYVYGSAEVEVRPTNNETLELAVEKNELDPGESATVVIKSPFRRAKALVAIERGTIFDYDVIDVNQNLVPYTFTAKDEHIPNAYLSVLLLSDRPEVKYGQVNFRVNTKTRELDVAVSSDKNHYLPGEQVKLNVAARDRNGKPVEAELSLAVVDLSVLALKGNPKKNPVQFFYGGLPLTVVTASNIKNILFEAEVPAGTKGGGGAGAPEDLARRKRGEFRDTAFWDGVVRTDKDGRADVTFTLPDNLTTWQAEAVAITKDTKTGAGYGEFKSRKDLMVVPLRPRFIIPGDEFKIGAQIFNQTDGTLTFNVGVASPSLELRDAPQRSVTIAAGEAQTVHFAVTAPANREDGAHAFTLSAKTSGYEDTVEQSIPIVRNDTYETVATANATNESSAREYVYIPDNVIPDKGGVSIKANATLAIFLTDALQYLVEYPYGCSEQIASKIAGIAAVKRALKLSNVGEQFSLKPVKFEGREYSADDVVAIGLARILANQSFDGGFVYYPGMRSGFGLTLHILNTLADLKAAGYAVEDAVMARAATFIAREVSSRPEYVQSADTAILAAYALSRVPASPSAPAAGNINIIRNRVMAAVADRKFVNEDVSNLTLVRLAMLQDYPASVREAAFTTLGNRVSIDARGAHLTVARGRCLCEYYESPITDTALYVKALAQDRRQSPVMDKILRWIATSRTKDGAWGSSNATLAAIDGLVSYLEWSGETESRFDLSVLFDGKEKGAFSFAPETIWKTFNAEIPMSELAGGAMHALDFQKKNEISGKRNFYYEASLRYFLPIDAIPPRDEGIAVNREFFRREDEKGERPVADAAVGEVLRGRLTITAPTAMNLVAIEDFIPAGFEIVNTRFATEDRTLSGNQYEYRNDYEYDDYNYNADNRQVVRADGGPVSFLANILGLGGVGEAPDLPDEEYSPRDHIKNRTLYPTAEESHDDRLFLFVERLLSGVYTYEYYARALVPGKFHHRPAVASQMYFPEVFGRTRGGYFTVGE